MNPLDCPRCRAQPELYGNYKTAGTVFGIGLRVLWQDILHGIRATRREAHRATYDDGAAAVRGSWFQPVSSVTSRQQRSVPIQVGRRNLVSLQMRMTVEIEPLRGPFMSVLGQDSDGIDRPRADRQGPFDGSTQLGRFPTSPASAARE